MTPDRCGATEGRGRHGRRTTGRLPDERALLHGHVRRAQGRLSDRIAHLEQPPRRDGPGCGLRRPTGAARLHRVPRLPGRARSQLHPALALGAVPVPGRRRRLPPLHDAAAVGAHRPGCGQGRQAEVRPRPVRPGVLRAAPGPGRRRGRTRHVRRGDVLRRVGAAPEPRARSCRGSPVPRGQQREPGRNPFHRGLSGPAARAPGAGAAGVLRPQGGRHPPRPAESALGGGERVLRRWRRRSRVR